MEKLLNQKRKRLLGFLNVNGCCIGLKEDGSGPVITVFVEKKVNKKDLHVSQILPDSIAGVEVNVIEVGTIKALNRTSKIRPVPAGVSISHSKVTAGTLGLWLKLNDKTVGLSNNHVLANENNASIGDLTLQPGTYDGGQLNDSIGTLLDFEPIKFDAYSCQIGLNTVKLLNFIAKLLGRTSRFSYRSEPDNLIDAAIFSPYQDIPDLTVVDYDLGYPIKIDLDPPFGANVIKSGRTTGTTSGKIIGKNATIRVQYGAGKIATFTDQFISDAHSEGGDSGSSFIDVDNNSLIGLLFAGSSNITILNPIRYILNKWAISLP